MMDHDGDRDELRAWAASVFRSDEPPPPDDIVDRGAWRGLTAEDIRRLNGTAGTWAEATQPGEVICDIDGAPVGMTEPRTETVYRAPAIVTRSQLYKVGLTPADVPNLVVMDDPKPKGNQR